MINPIIGGGRKVLNDIDSIESAIANINTSLQEVIHVQGLKRKQISSPIHDVDLIDYLKQNMINNSYIVVSFYSLKNNPFTKINTGYCLACFSFTISNSIFILGFNSTTSEVVSIDWYR